VTAQVTLEAHLGLQNTVRLEKWNPVTVHLFNAGAPLEGTLGLRVWRGSEFRQDLHVTTFTQAVTLPQRTRKRFTFSVPITSISHPVDVFLQQGSTILAQRQLDLRETLSAEHIILGLTRDLSLDFLATAFERHTRIAYLTPQDLPQRWSGYDSASAVVVKGVSLQALTEKQATALQQWLARGGTLIVAGDSQYALLQEPRMRALLPVEVLGVRQQVGLAVFAEHYGLPVPDTPLLAVQARLHSGNVLVGTSEEPLLAQRSYGKGRVVFLGVDYATQPLAGWPGNAALWREMLQPSDRIDFSRAFAELGLLDEAHPIMKVLRRPVLAFPSHLVLSLVLCGYCGGLGLLFWRMGKRQARPWRYWAGMLCLVLVAVLGAYSIFPEHGLRRSALVADLSTIEVLPDTSQAHMHGYLGLFSTRGGDYTLEAQSAEAILRHTFSRGAGKAGVAIEVSAAESLRLRGIRLDPWTLRVFSIEGMMAAPFQVEARRHAGGATLLVKNTGTAPLQGAVVVYHGRLFALGVVAPGEEIFEDLYTTLQPVESKQETTWQALLKFRPAVAELRQTYLQEVLLQQFFGEKRLESQETPFLAGWIMAPTTLGPAVQELPVRGMTLVVSRLPL
jgi:hypothetical protein